MEKTDSSQRSTRETTRERATAVVEGEWKYYLDDSMGIEAARKRSRVQSRVVL
jgi:hypothetical protein